MSKDVETDNKGNRLYDAENNKPKILRRRQKVSKRGEITQSGDSNNARELDEGATLPNELESRLICEGVDQNEEGENCCKDKLDNVTLDDFKHLCDRFLPPNFARVAKNQADLNFQNKSEKKHSKESPVYLYVFKPEFPLSDSTVC